MVLQKIRKKILEFVNKFFKDLFGRTATFPQVIHNGIKIGGASDTLKFMKENEII